jgi:Rad3-related DNA helicase
MLISGNKFDGKFNPPKGMSFLGVVEWLKETERLLLKIIDKAASVGRTTRALMDLDFVQNTLMGVTNSPSSYVHEYDKETGDLIVFPISPPRELINRLLQCDRLILMSATLYERDVKNITTEPYVFKEFESPIDASRRRITIKEGYTPNMNAETPPELVALWIKDRLKEYPGLNTVVHVTYSMSKKLKKFLPGCLTNEPETKKDVLDEFKRTGGVWLASGCAEGLDLRDKLCELTLIPILPSPNIEDPVYKRRLALPFGQEDYDIRVLKTVQQQSGRATRHPKDKSLTIVGSRRYLTLVSKYRPQLPLAYQEQIWGSGGARR